MRINANELDLKLWSHSILKNLKQKYFDFLMLGVNKKSQILRYPLLTEVKGFSRFNKMYFSVSNCITQ